MREQDVVDHFASVPALDDPARAVGLPRGAANRMGRSTCGASARRSNAPGSPPTRPASTCCTPVPDFAEIPAIQRFDEHFVLDIWWMTARRAAWVALNMMEGTRVQIRANAVVTTGGAGRVYRYNTNGGIVTGDAWAWRSTTACRCATWSSCSITRPACPVPAS
ncbi:hypothetical protein M8494_36750 [Serratia ureilytica]